MICGDDDRKIESVVLWSLNQSFRHLLAPDSVNSQHQSTPNRVFLREFLCVHVVYPVHFYKIKYKIPHSNQKYDSEFYTDLI